MNPVNPYGSIVPSGIKPQGPIISGSQSTGLEIKVNPRRRTPETKTTHDLLTTLILELPKTADRVARKWAARMAQKAIQLAPSSEASRALGHERNKENPLTTKKGIDIVGKDARYTIRSRAPQSVYTLQGTKAHAIRARATGAMRNVRQSQRRMERMIQRRERIRYGITRTGRTRDTGVFARVYERKRVLQNGQIERYEVERKLSARDMRVIQRRRTEAARADALAMMAQGFMEDESRRAESGRSLLIFPWRMGRARKTREGKWFIGPVVKRHPGTRKNDFLAKARGQITPGFTNDLRRMLEGRFTG